YPPAGRREGLAREAGVRGCRQHARRVRRLHQGGAREVVEALQGAGAPDRTDPLTRSNHTGELSMAKDDTLGAYNIHDLREMAQKRLPKGLWEFMDRGTEDEVSLRNNREVFNRIRFKPRTLVDVSK